MKTIRLDGRWALTKRGDDVGVLARVPGDALADLLRAKRIPDPFDRENEVDLQWIGESDWVYERGFTVAAALLKQDRVLLQCEGLDTFATVEINGTKVADTDNMFRSYEWDVKRLLQPGDNQIRITFTSVIPYTRARNRQRPFRSRIGESHKTAYPGWVRKEASNFGWDWGPILVSSGIWRSIRLVALSTARLSDVRIDQDHAGRGVSLRVHASVDAGGRSAGTVRATALYEGAVVASAEAAQRSRGTHLDLDIADPKLWWPNGMGEHPLYEVRVELLGADGATLDSQTKRIGLRTLGLDRHADEWGESFQFVVNGVAFFAKGANWIPVDAVLARRTPDLYRTLVADAAAANMNMLRVWGGGVYEDDVFYEACDELGLCVWQDFMFACMSYPAFDPAFMETVEAEARDNVRRIRHHACLALWCGNNEIEQQACGDEWSFATMSWKDYGLLFDHLLADVVHAEDPQRDYWPSSPHSPHGDRSDDENPKWGDAHLWAVWHGKKPFEWYRTANHRFCSEFGFQSFPEPRTVNGYTDKEDRNITTAVMEHHQRSGIGNTTIMQYMLEWFRLPSSFDMTLWASQILQGMAITYAVEHWRRNMPQSMGALYWQLNDCWPVASWASIDFHGRWKALHYMARRFFAPVMVSGVEDAAKGTVDVHITSDLLKTAAGTLTWVVTDTAGRTRRKGVKELRTPVNASRKALTLKLADLQAEHGDRDLMVWIELAVKGQPLSTSLVTFVKPKHLTLDAKPPITATVAANKNGSFRVALRSDRPALWAWVALDGVDARCSDNFIHLRPGRTVRLTVTPARALTLAAFKKALQVRSLADTYAP